MAAKRDSGLFSKIETRDGALKAVKSTSSVFFVVAGINVIGALALDPAGWFDVFAFALFGFLLRQFNSRAAAVILLVLSLGVVAVTFANRIGAGTGGGANIFLSLILFGTAVRAVRATWKLHGQSTEEEGWVRIGNRGQPRPATETKPSTATARATASPVRPLVARQTYLPKAS